jgi:phospholipid transport system transporter-binding protein
MTTLESLSANLANVSGDMLASTMVALIEPGHEMIRSSGGEWCLDMSNVDRVSSAAVALLLDWMRTARQHDIHMTIRSVPERLMPILQVSDLEVLFAEVMVTDA